MHIRNHSENYTTDRRYYAVEDKTMKPQQVLVQKNRNHETFDGDLQDEANMRNYESRMPQDSSNKQP